MTDAWLKGLKELKGLEALFLYQTRVTDAGLKDLQVALPHCQIFK